LRSPWPSLFIDDDYGRTWIARSRYRRLKFSDSGMVCIRISLSPQPVVHTIRMGCWVRRVVMRR
jgi:hypothetical protein